MANTTSSIRWSTDRWPVDLNKYRFDHQKADLVVRFFHKCITHVEGDLTGQLVELPPHWERVLREVFGWVHIDTGLRKHKFVDLFVPRKNFKSGIVGGVMLYMTSLEAPKSRKQSYIVAPTEKQSKETFRLCKLMCEQNAWLSKNFEITEEALTFLPNKSILRFLSGSKTGKTGKNASALLWEEWQEITKQDLVSSMETSIISRAEPLIFKIGTGGDQPDENLPGYKEWLNARRIVNGELEMEDHYILLCEAAEDADCTDTEVLASVNPGWGTSVNAQTVASLIKKAKNDPAEMAKLKQYHANVWVQKSSQFLSIDHWRKCFDPGLTEESLYGKECFGGLDLGGSNTTGGAPDMSSFVLWFPEWRWEKDDAGDLMPIATYKKLIWYWTPEAGMDDMIEHGAKYDKWSEMGQLIITPGNVADYPLIRKTIASFKKRFNILGIGYDPYRAQEMAQLLQDQHKLSMVSVSQGWNQLSEPTLKFKELVLTTEIKHTNNEVFLWNLQCARTIKSVHDDQIVSSKCSRGDNGRGKVDGISAGVTGLRLAINAPPPKRKRRMFVVG